MAVKIIMAGAFTTVQDTGRYGYQKSGITPAGVMDRDAYAAANYLAGNDAYAAVLEMTLFGGTFEFTEETVFALTGADMQPLLDGQAVPLNRPWQAGAGQQLTLGTAVSGCRTYLAVSGGIDVPPVMGSRSTFVKCAMGGFHGRALRSGDELPVGTSAAAFADIAERRTAQRKFAPVISVRVIAGPQADYFTEQGLRTFYGTEYEVSTESDRMGYRLSGAAVESRAGTDIISDGIVFGSVQVPAGGRPIILLADRQTTGGYAKIATVCSFDLPQVAQAKPGDKIRFEQITLDAAQKIKKSEDRRQIR